MPDPNPNPDPKPNPTGNPPPAGGSDPSPTPGKPARPEGLGKQFDAYWSDDKGLDTAKLTSDFDALTALRAEHDSRLARVPEKLDDYEVALPEGFKLPDGFKFEIDANSPLLTPAREFAKKHNLTKDEFKELVALQAQGMVAEDAALAAAAKAERDKLGSKGQQRISAVTQFLQAKLGNDLANALLPGLFTARQVEAYEKIMDLAKGGGGAPFNGGGREPKDDQQISDEEWARMSPTQRLEYSRKHAKPAKAA